MNHSRRDFIKATAAASVLGGAEARAATSTDNWLAFLHSTYIDPAWQLAFLSGLRTQGWEGDPSQTALPGKGVNIHYFQAGSRYTSSANSNLGLAVKNMISELPAGQPKLFIATGGMVSAYALSGNAVYPNTTTAVPSLCLMGRQASSGLPASNVGGFYIDPLPNASNTNNNLQQKSSYLKLTYGIPVKNQWLMYNANSGMAGNEIQEWPVSLRAVDGTFTDTTPGRNCVDASFKNNDNTKVNIEAAIQSAIFDATNPAQAIVISADPHFYTQRGRIISHATRAMTKANKPLIVCFPFLDWISGHGLSSESVMVYGPNLAAAYESLGTQAGMYLNAPITYSFAFSMLPSSYLFGK